MSLSERKSLKKQRLSRRMRRLIMAAAIIFGSMAFTACTKENVNPVKPAMLSAEDSNKDQLGQGDFTDPNKDQLGQGDGGTSTTHP